MKRTRHKLRPMASNGACHAWKVLKRMLSVKTASASWLVHILENTQFPPRTSIFRSTKCFLTLTEPCSSCSRRTIRERRNALREQIKTWKTYRPMQLSSMNVSAGPPVNNHRVSWRIWAPTSLWTVVRTTKQCNYSSIMTKTQRKTETLWMLLRTKTCQHKLSTTNLASQSARLTNSQSKTPCIKNADRCILNSTSTTWESCTWDLGSITWLHFNSPKRSSS